ncbi:hypothetical protein [Virgibacillus proomii]|uniref:hypothetical protein n=1 Tax=Virgibacillus proomii TaxID=84407 RepID=UPI000986888C|nr:hypothetical protein [Virgibacillus proomii]
MIINGSFIKEKDVITKVFTYLLNQKQFNALVEKLQNLMTFKPNQLMVESIYEFVAHDIPKDNATQLLSGKTTTLRVDNKLEIVNVFAETKGKEKVYDEFFIRVNNNGEEASYFYANDGLRHLVTKTTGKQVLEENDYTNEIDNPNFKPFSTISPQVNFCVPGGYKHCGPGCGDGLKYGGGTPKNQLDKCCRAHDRCWKSFGSWDACCDLRLVVCAETAKGSPIAKRLVQAPFVYNASKCKTK